MNISDMIPDSVIEELGKIKEQDTKDTLNDLAMCVNWIERFGSPNWDMAERRKSRIIINGRVSELPES